MHFLIILYNNFYTCNIHILTSLYQYYNEYFLFILLILRLMIYINIFIKTL
jgi:hypothetical protein